MYDRNITINSSLEGVFAVVEKRDGYRPEVHYVLKDNLGSWTTITYAWGNRRNVSTWNGPANDTPMFDRGFTGHEHYDDFGLINMNGRLYDPLVGRFMQTDPMAENNAWLTPYHYCSNNPVRKIDPTGMLDDWFENEETGEIYYNVNMHEGDEGTGDMKGSGWKWLGPNGMFTDGDMEAEISLIAQNHGRIDMGRGDISLMLDSNSAKSFMSTQDYKQVPTQTLEYSYSYTESYSTIPGHSFHITYGENYRYWEKVAYVPKDFDVISTIPVGQVLYGKQHSYPFYIPQVTRNIYSYEQPTIWRFLGKTIKTLNGYHDYVNSYDCGSVDNYIKNGGGNPLIDLYIKRYPK